jgi:hypothetical protein
MPPKARSLTTGETVKPASHSPRVGGGGGPAINKEFPAKTEKMTQITMTPLRVSNRIFCIKRHTSVTQILILDKSLSENRANILSIIN